MDGTPPSSSKDPYSLSPTSPFPHFRVYSVSLFLLAQGKGLDLFLISSIKLYREPSAESPVLLDVDHSFLEVVVQ